METPDYSYGDRFDHAKESVRGWSMRRGHCKKLLRSARTCRTLEDFAMGSTPTTVGRAVYKRTCNKSSRDDNWFWVERLLERRVMESKARKLEINEELSGFSFYDDQVDESDIDGSTDWSSERCDQSECDSTSCSSPKGSSNSSWEWPDDDMSCDSVSTAYHSAQSHASPTNISKSCGKLRTAAQLGCCDVAPKRHARWDAGVQRAAAAAKHYSQAAHVKPVPQTQRSRTSGANQVPHPAAGVNADTLERYAKRMHQLWKQLEVSKKATDIRALVDAHQALVRNSADEAELINHTAKVFEAVRELFLLHHERQVLENVKRLQTSRPNSCYARKLQPFEVSPAVQLRFLKAFLRCGGPEFTRDASPWLPLWHGTRSCHLNSISQRGLLVPGSRSDVKVVHGSAHGLGVYTARVTAPWLSEGFASRGGLLVCAGMDQSVALSQTQMHKVGAYTVTRESSSVRHVGDAVVFFDHSLVAPLFTLRQENRIAPIVRQKTPAATQIPPRARKGKKAPGEVARASRGVLTWLFQRGRRRRMTAAAGRGAMWMKHMTSK